MIDHEALIDKAWTQYRDTQDVRAGGPAYVAFTKAVLEYGRAVERWVWEQAITELKRRAEFYTATRDAHTQTRDIQFNEAMGCVETLEKCRAQGV